MQHIYLFSWRCLNLQKPPKSLVGPNAGRMLVVHSDDRQSGDGRAMVHNAGHNLADECWVIVSVEEQGVSQGYTIMKSQVFAFFAGV